MKVKDRQQDGKIFSKIYKVKEVFLSQQRNELYLMKVPGMTQKDLKSVHKTEIALLRRIPKVS